MLKLRPKLGSIGKENVQRVVLPKPSNPVLPPYGPRKKFVVVSRWGKYQLCILLAWYSSSLGFFYFPSCITLMRKSCNNWSCCSYIWQSSGFDVMHDSTFLGFSIPMLLVRLSIFILVFYLNLHEVWGVFRCFLV